MIIVIIYFVDSVYNRCFYRYRSLIVNCFYWV